MNSNLTRSSKILQKSLSNPAVVYLPEKRAFNKLLEIDFPENGICIIFVTRIGLQGAIKLILHHLVE